MILSCVDSLKVCVKSVENTTESKLVFAGLFRTSHLQFVGISIFFNVLKLRYKL